MSYLPALCFPLVLAACVESHRSATASVAEVYAQDGSILCLVRFSGLRTDAMVTRMCDANGELVMPPLDEPYSLKHGEMSAVCTFARPRREAIDCRLVFSYSEDADQMVPLRIDMMKYLEYARAR